MFRRRLVGRRGPAFGVFSIFVRNVTLGVFLLVVLALLGVFLSLLFDVLPGLNLLLRRLVLRRAVGPGRTCRSLVRGRVGSLVAIRFVGVRVVFTGRADGRRQRGLDCCGLLRGGLRKLGCTAVSQDKRSVTRGVQHNRVVLLVDIEDVEHTVTVYHQRFAVVRHIAFEFAAPDPDEGGGRANHGVGTCADRLQAPERAAAVAEATDKDSGLEVADVLVRIRVIDEVELIETGAPVAAQAECGATGTVAVVHPREEKRIRSGLDDVAAIDQVAASQGVFTAVRVSDLHLTPNQRDPANRGP